LLWLAFLGAISTAGVLVIGKKEKNFRIILKNEESMSA